MKYSITNVNNYLLGNKYNKDTIIDDINTSIDLLINNSTYYLLNDLRNNLSIYLSKRAQESINFINFIYTNNYDNPVIYNLFEKYSLPFIDSRDSMADELILSKLFGIENIKLSQAIYYLACFKDKEYITRLDVRDMLTKLLDTDGIDFGSVGYGNMYGKELSYRESDEDIIDNMEALRSNFGNKGNTTVDHYAELVAYNYISDRLGDGQKIYWVSRDLGYSFGYDIAVINSDNSAILYEVNGLFNKEEITLSGKESFMSRECNNHNDLEYHHIAVLVSDNDALVDIHRLDNGIMYAFHGDNDLDATMDNKKILVRKE